MKITIIIAFLVTCSYGYNLHQKFGEEGELSQFYALLLGNKAAKAALMYREITIFAPKNGAFENFDGTLTEDLILYHIVPTAKQLDSLKDEQKIDTILECHPPLWINKKGEDVFINNAKILRNESNFIAQSRNDYYGKKQILHIIDEVLDPKSTTTSEPAAFDLISNYNDWDIHPYTFNVFYKKIEQNHMQALYKNERFSTFFIPVDQYLDNFKTSSINKDVIKWNIVPNRVIFTQNAYDDYSYTTRGIERDFYHTVQFMGDDAVKIKKINKITMEKENEKIVEILFPNIPVQNGVVHVIKEPLGIFPRKLTKFPYLPLLDKLMGDPNLNITNYFFGVTELYKMINNTKMNFTLFIPDDSAWKNLAKSKGFEMLEYDGELFRERLWKIVKRHIVLDEIIHTHRLLHVSKDHEVIVKAGDNLMIRAYIKDGATWLKWGQKEIKIKRANYEAPNGLMHIIDTPFLFDSELKGFSSVPNYNSLLFRAWNFLQTIG